MADLIPDQDVSSSAAEDEPAGARGTRRRWLRPILLLLVLGFAVHLLLPQVAELEQGLAAMRSGRWPWLLLVVAFAGLVFVAAAWMVHASVTSPPSWSVTLMVQVAAGFASTVTPAGVGWFTVTQSALQQSGTEAEEAQAATALNLVLTVVAHVGLLLVMIPFLPTLNLPRITPPDRRIALDVTVAVAVVAGALMWIPHTRRRLLAWIIPVLREVPAVLGNPKRTITMVAGAVAQNLAYAAALLASLAAFGASAPFVGVFVVYMIAATVAAISPTPGGLGAMEAALVAGFTRLGIPGGPAIAAVLAFRIVTFWLPIPIGAWLLARGRKRSWS